MNRFLKQIDGKPDSLATVEEEIAKAFQDERAKQINYRVLAKHGLTLDEFNKTGSKRLSKTRYESVSAEIAVFELGTQLLVGGRGDQGTHHLLGVFDPGCVEHFTGNGYAAIGISHEAALKMFGFRGYPGDHQ